MQLFNSINDRLRIAFITLVLLCVVLFNSSFADVTLSTGGDFNNVKNVENVKNEKNATASESMLKNNKQLVAVGLTHADDLVPSDINVSQIVLTQDQKHQAIVWGLSEQQEKRYVALMRGKMGFYFKKGQTDLSPVEILGMAARNDKERNEYAKHYAQIDNHKVGRELAWSHAAFNAKRQLYKNMPFVKPFDYRPFSPYNRHPVTFKQGDSFNLFFNLSDSVAYVMTYLLRRMGESPNFTLNIYIKNASNSEVQQWAHNHNIKFTDVASGRITLNNQSQLFSKIKSLPYAFKVTRDTKGKLVSEIVNLGKF